MNNFTAQNISFTDFKFNGFYSLGEWRPFLFIPLYYHKYKEICNFLKFVYAPLIRNGLLIVAIVSLAGRLSFCATNVIDHCFMEHMALVQLACGDTSINNIVGLLTVFLVPALDFILITVSYIAIFTSVFKSGKSHTKALNTCITHLIVLSVALISALIAFLSYRIRNNISSNNRIVISVMYLCVPSCFNPIIYGWRTKEIRHVFLKFINQKVFSLEK
ncbi:LOW QUALITY PROTEIN: olfactory receptor 52L1-like [Puntigrus tetrazona]|uniref:LOW QUALITY PROTEIN: olfactory receptor 52L1-like n=1 Tax=Puntigrus tetrazona TaxID=1606681 RepID=UPI001C893144|nr:LOW QUALITY PROTEIN: olfactory receptor 52L1-like [Puntigrus tetrazona]